MRPFGFAALLGLPGPCGTRFAQTVLGLYPDSPVLLARLDGDCRSVHMGEIIALVQTNCVNKSPGLAGALFIPLRPTGLWQTFAGCRHWNTPRVLRRYPGG